MKKICVVTSTRADYGILKPLITRLHRDSGIDLSIVATGMHLCTEFGETYNEIESDGFVINKKIDIQLSSDTPSAVSKTMGIALISFSDYFREHPHDILIVLGDRYEIMAICCAATNQRIPIAHIHGGETTEGAIDECYRHSITKMSALHFTSCETYRNRVIQLGEQPSRVFNVGALGVENIFAAPLMSIESLEHDIGFNLSDKPYGVVTFHPVTLENETGTAQIRELLSALDDFPDMRFIITKANSDVGGRKINKILDDYGKNRDNCYLTSSLGMIRYLSAIKHAVVIIGNSSSGILEGPAVKVPTVNIGDRQKGRIMAASVINCNPVAGAIVSAINKSLSQAFQDDVNMVVNPYGDGNTSKQILAIVHNQLDNGLSVSKSFYNISREVICK